MIAKCFFSDSQSESEMEAMEDIDETETFFSLPVQKLYDALSLEITEEDQACLSSLNLLNDCGILQWEAVANLLNGMF